MMNKSLLATFFGAAIALTFTVVLASYSSNSSANGGYRMKFGDPLPTNTFVELAKKINPAVVNISTSTLPKRMPRRNRRNHPRDPFFEMFEQFMVPRQNMMPRQSLGTGFIIRKDGLILTNNHVVDKADIIKVSLTENGEDSYEAKVIGKDASTDIALIKIEGKKPFPVATLGTSKDLQVGEWVAAFGNPFGHGHTVTKGIISAIGREIDEINRFPFIQTDASINPGNSGGPLVNTKGEVIAVNTAIDARAQGIGFAIPIDNVKGIITALERDGQIKRGYIGVYLAEVNNEAAEELSLKSTNGVLITQVLKGGPAYKAGLKPYDFIVKYNGKAVKSVPELINGVSGTPSGSKVIVEVIREGSSKNLTMKIENHPDDKKLQAKQQKLKSYKGQTAPFGLGFRVANYSKSISESYGLPKLRKARPVVISVKRGSPASRAGLYEGDIVLDVNKQTVYRARDVLKKLRQGQVNLLRVLREDTAVLVWLRP